MAAEAGGAADATLDAERASARASIRGSVVIGSSAAGGGASGEAERLVPVHPGAADGDDAVWPPSAWFILVVEFCERLAFYGATIVFYPYMQHMLGMKQGTANAVYNAFNFWAYATTVLGGWIADTYLGKVRAIILFAVTYFIGLSLLTLSAAPFTWKSGDFPDTASGLAVPGFLVAIFFTGLGTGGIKSNVSTLMADQLGDCSPKAYSTVFRWFYWSINLGAFTGILVSPILYTQLGEKKELDEDEDDDDIGTAFYASYGMPTVFFVIALAIFIVGHYRRLYIDRPPTGSLVGNAVSAARCALRVRAQAQLRGSSARPHWLDWARDDPEWGAMSRDLKMALRACVVFCFFPIYWLCYNQMFSNFVAQADLLERPSWLAAPALNVLGALTLILIIPVFDRVIFPLLKRYGHDPNPIQRIAFGFFLAGVSIMYCGVLEYFIHQRGHFDDEDDYHLDDEDGRMILIWWQIPPYIIFGISEIFASVGGLEFAYAEAPKSMKSLVMSIFLLTNALSSIIGILVSPAIEPKNMVAVFMSFGAVMLATVPVFYCIFRHRRSNTEADPSVDAEEEMAKEPALPSKPAVEG